MSLLVVSVVAIFSLFLVLLMGIIVFFYFKKNKERLALLNLQVESISLFNNELQSSLHKDKQLLGDLKSTTEQSTLENEQVSKQLEHRIKSLQSQLVEQEQRLAQWQDNQGQDKFYNRAFKLAAKGADTEEIMNECELPRAEVEMLLSVYQQRSGNQ